MNKIKITLILVLFFALTFIFMYPVILNINTHIAGFYSTDEPYGVIWSFWWSKFLFLNKISPNFINVIAHPYGIKVNNISYFPLWGLMTKYIGILFNEIVAYNVVLLSTFVLSAITMYTLMFFLTKNTGASIFSSLIYAFCPFHFVRIWQHFGTAQIQWMPLYILLLFKLWQDRNIKPAFWLGLSLALNYYFDVHYAYFMVIFTFLFFVLVLFSNASNTEKFKFIKLLILAAFIGTLLIIPAFLPFLERIVQSNRQAASAYSFVRPFEDLFAQSARPLSYFLPFTEHPIFGKSTKMFVGSDMWGQSLTEHNIFLGFIPLLLNITLLVKRKTIIPYIKQEGKDISFRLRFFFLLVVLAWIFSQPPWWNVFGMKIYMPSFFMYKILPMFRAYVRFAIVVMLGISVLAGFGLAFILDKFKSPKMKIAVIFLICFLSLYEFWSNPKEHILNLSKYPKAYDWLKEQPGDFVIAEYPLETEGPNELYKFYQTKHQKKIINGTLPGSYANEVAKTITKLSEPKTSGVLKWMGVKYVLVHRQDYIDTGLVDDSKELNKIPQNSGLKFIKIFSAQECPRKDIMCVQKSGPIDVYEIVALPIEPKVEK